MADSPELAAAKRLVDDAKDRGFRFQRVAPGEDGPLRGVRDTPEHRDEIYLAGFGAPESCTAIRPRRSSLIVPGGLPVTVSWPHGSHPRPGWPPVERPGRMPVELPRGWRPAGPRSTRRLYLPVGALPGGSAATQGEAQTGTLPGHRRRPF